MSTNIEVQRVCQYCSCVFTARTTVTRFCSNACSSKAYKANVKSLKIKLSNNETQRIIDQPIEHLKAKGFKLLEDDSAEIKRLAKEEGATHIIDTGMLFVKA